jgi:thiol-disulfide isomerase/thioredoxin
MKQTARHSAIQILGVLLFLVLAYQLVRIKEDNAELRAEIARGTHSFVLGGTLPAVSLLNARKVVATLPQVCAGRAPVVAVFWSNKCKACGRLRPLLTEVGRRRRDVRIVLVGVDGVLPAPDLDIGSGVRAVTSAREVSTRFHIVRTPTIVASDELCRIAAASSSSVASESLLKTLLTDAPQ